MPKEKHVADHFSEKTLIFSLDLIHPNWQKTAEMAIWSKKTKAHIQSEHQERNLQTPEWRFWYMMFLSSLSLVRDLQVSTFGFVPFQAFHPFIHILPLTEPTLQMLHPFVVFEIHSMGTHFDKLAKPHLRDMSWFFGCLFDGEINKSKTDSKMCIYRNKYNYIYVLYIYIHYIMYT